MASYSSGSFSPSNGIYRSIYSAAVPELPSGDIPLSLPEFLLSFSYNAGTISSKPAFIDAATGETIAYSDLISLIRSAAAALSSVGVRQGDVVLLVAPNFLHFPIIALAVMSLGAIFSTANFLHTRSEIQSQVHDSNPILIVTTIDLQDKLNNLVQKPLVLIEHFIPSLTTYSIDKTNLEAHVLQKRSDVAALMYSSGTTGKSKGVTCTHGGLVSMAAVLRHVWGKYENEVYLCAVPLSHMFGFSVFVCGAMAAGTTVVVMGKYAAEGVLTAVVKYSVTKLPAAPPMVVQLTRAVTAPAKKFELGSLREVVCSGAPLGREHIERFCQRFPRVMLTQCYGLTETCGPITLFDEFKGRFSTSIGRLIPSVEAKIVDVRTGKPLAPKRIGELYVRGPSLMKGYLNNQEATDKTIDKDGWLHTGDLCYIDMQGFVFVVDRIKELIKYKAYQVAPAELEEILLTHPDIVDVAVIPHPDEEAGEIPMACIVRKEKSVIKEDDIISFMENKVAPYKKIRKVRFVNFIPRSPSGKILRRVLKDSTIQDQRIDIRAML